MTEQEAYAQNVTQREKTYRDRNGWSDDYIELLLAQAYVAGRKAWSEEVANITENSRFLLDDASHRDMIARQAEQIKALQQQVEALTKERDEWHSLASSHLMALCEKQAEVNALQLTWTDEQPTTPGWYWWRWKIHGYGERPVFVDIARDGALWTLPAVALQGGQWAGPISEPKETQP